MYAATDPPPSSPDPDPRPLTLYCGVCGRTQTSTPDEMLRYARDGWPRCCGQVMGFFPAPSVPPDPLE